MGFDFEIRISLGICEQTGRPYYYSNEPDNKYKKNYDLSAIVVPKEYRASFQLRGKHLHAYTDYFNEQEVYSTSVNSFLEQFPDWTIVKEFLEQTDNDYWTHEDHLNLFFALVWCTKTNCHYTVEWSY